MIPISLLNQTVTIKRRTSTGRDSLNNPTYGSPTDGAGWNTVYDSFVAKLAFSSKPTKFAPEGERITPVGTMYYNPGPELKVEDRVLTESGIEYTVISIVPAYVFGKNIDHFEAVLQLP